MTIASTASNSTPASRSWPRTVASNADPKTTLLGLLGAEHLDAGFVRRVSHLRMQGLAAKLHLALEDLPRVRWRTEQRRSAVAC